MDADDESSPAPGTRYLVSLTRIPIKGPALALEGPVDLVDLMLPLITDLTREHFYGVYMNDRSQVLAVELVSLGNSNTVPVTPRDVLKPAVGYGATKYAVCHNHPGGDPTPSVADFQFTSRLRRCGRLFKMDLVDHLILGDTAYSFLEHGDLEPGALD